MSGYHERMLGLSKYADVPVARGRIGAMGYQANRLPSAELEWFKPYVYRGAGEDEHPEWDVDYEEPKPKASPKKQPKPKPKPKPSGYRQGDEGRAAKRARAAEFEANRIERERGWVEFPETPPTQRGRFANASATPISLDDIEALLEEDDDD